MSTVRRAMIAGALAFPLALGTAGMASADTGYDAEGSYAGPDGVGTYSVSSHADNEPGDNGHTEDDITDDATENTEPAAAPPGQHNWVGGPPSESVVTIQCEGCSGVDMTMERLKKLKEQRQKQKH